jgi:tRNA pseudouridine55 synthase
LILNVDKPSGWTSFDVVNKLRRLLGWKAVGHAGTLDPPATGVLIVLCGAATARSAEFMELTKEYRARIRFGITTTTDDLCGEVLRERTIGAWDVERITNVLQSFVGDIEQIPPNVSAVKLSGKRSYALTQAGMTPALTPRKIRVYSARVINVCSPEIEVLISCSRGTYVRSIARDWGEKLEWGGALAGLIRTAVGPYRAANALSLDEITRRACEFSGE